MNLKERLEIALDGRLLNGTHTWELWATKTAMPLLRDALAYVQATEGQPRPPRHVASSPEATRAYWRDAMRLRRALWRINGQCVACGGDGAQHRQWCQTLTRSASREEHQP